MRNEKKRMLNEIEELWSKEEHSRHVSSFPGESNFVVNTVGDNSILIAGDVVNEERSFSDEQLETIKNLIDNSLIKLNNSKAEQEILPECLMEFINKYNILSQKLVSEKDYDNVIRWFARQEPGLLESLVARWRKELIEEISCMKCTIERMNKLWFITFGKNLTSLEELDICELKKLFDMMEREAKLNNCD